MKRNALLIIAAFALLVAACGTPAPSEDTVAAAQTAPAETTTTVQETTTTTEAPTTTTTTTTSEATTTTTTATPPELDTLAALQGALERSAAVTSGRMEGSMEVSGLDPSAGFTEIVMPFGGAFDDAGNFSFYMDMSSLANAAGDDIPPEMAGLFGVMEMRQIGDTAYLKFDFFTAFLGSETPWISMPAEDGTTTTDGFLMGSPGNPSEILGPFEDVGATVETIGSEEVNGVQATHYRAIFDMEALMEQATPEERAQLEAQGPLPADFMPLDLWVSDDGYVVRFVMEIDGTAVESPPGEGFDRMVMRYDLFDLGGDVAIEPPPADEVTDVEDLDFGF